MDNPENLSTLGSQVIGRRQRKQKTQDRKLKRLTTGSHLNQWDHEWQADCVIFGLKITPKKRF